MEKDSLGDRMKRYEDHYRFTIMPRMPVIIRVDGKAFHTITKGCEKPFDNKLAAAMNATAFALVEQIQNARMAFVQSDEVSVLLVDYNKYTSQQWFDGNLQKMVSISACIASRAFNGMLEKDALFDSRVFAIPEHEVANYFIWRQQDATRNSINMVAQSLYSHKQLQGMSAKKAQEMIFEKGINWNDYPTGFKRGRVATRDGVEYDPPIFTQDLDYISKFLSVEDFTTPQINEALNPAKEN